MFKLFSNILKYLAPIGVIYFMFLKKQEARVSLTMSGVVLLTLLLVTYYGRYKKWLARKEIAHETARNLGMTSKTTNFAILELMNFIFISLPFVILMGFSFVVENYEGDISVAISGILLCLLFSSVLMWIHKTDEQNKIAKAELHKKQQEQYELARLVKSKL